MRTLKRSSLGTLLLCGLLTACTETAAPTPTPTAINGTVSGWTVGAGTVTLQQGSTVLSSATLNSDGTFRLPLPATSAVTPYLSAMGDVIAEESGCGGKLTVSDQSARAYAVTELTATAGGSSQAIVSATSSMTQTTMTVDARLWVYADRDVRLGGSVTCTYTQEGVSFDGKLSANARLHTGWNILKVGATLTQNGTNTSASVNIENTADTASTWTSQSQAAPLSTAKVGSRQAALLGKLEKMVPFQK